MDKHYKPVYIKGTKTGEGTIGALTALGGINNCHYRGADCDSIYLILPDNHISATPINSAYAKYVMATARELKPLRWRAERDSSYYFIAPTLEIEETYESKDSGDDKLYNYGNYFRTREKAQEMVEKIKKILLPD